MSSHPLPFYPPIDQSYGSRPEFVSSPPQPVVNQQQSQYQKYSNNVMYQHQIPINSVSTSTATTYTSTPKQVNVNHHYNLHQAPSYSMVSPPTSNYTASVAQKRSLSTEDDEADSTRPASKRLDCYTTNEKSASYQQQYLNR